MRDRTRPAFHAALGLAIVAEWVVWWLPTVLAGLGLLAADRARFRMVLLRVDVLCAFGRSAAARRVLDKALERIEARRQALAGRSR